MSFRFSRPSSRRSSKRGGAYLWLHAAFLVGFIVFIYVLQHLSDSDSSTPNSSSSVNLLRSHSDKPPFDTERPY
ncbi:MAG: hypothetical protein WA984_01525 [Phormidesmis sp.]